MGPFDTHGLDASRVKGVKLATNVAAKVPKIKCYLYFTISKDFDITDFIYLSVPVCMLKGSITYDTFSIDKFFSTSAADVGNR